MSMMYNGTYDNTVQVPLSTYDHVVLDLETLGTSPGAPIVQIGAVAFNVGTPDYEWGMFEAKIDLTSLRFKENIDFSTLAWWFQQDEAARYAAFCTDERKPITEALRSFQLWLLGTRAKELWGNGSDFDNAILKCAFLQYCEEVEPWNFRMNRCFRTVKAMYKGTVLEPYFIGIKHNALDDAIHQARWLNDILTYKATAESVFELHQKETLSKATQ